MIEYSFCGVWITEEQKQAILRRLFYPRVNYLRQYDIGMGMIYRAESLTGQTMMELIDDGVQYVFTAKIQFGSLASPLAENAMHMLIKQTLQTLGVEFCENARKI